MNSAKVYKKEEFWFVDYIDSNYETIPAVGIFVNEEEARAAAEDWKNESVLENMGKIAR
jgi:Uri superfamily endonuclease